jgi:hypothetical protein
MGLRAVLLAGVTLPQLDLAPWLPTMGTRRMRSTRNTWDTMGAAR